MLEDISTKLQELTETNKQLQMQLQELQQKHNKELQALEQQLKELEHWYSQSLKEEQTRHQEQEEKLAQMVKDLETKEVPLISIFQEIEKELPELLQQQDSPKGRS